MTPKHDRPTRHRFILNPFCQERFASCPKCRGTLDHDVWDRGRRFPLSISEMVSELYVFQEVLLIESTGEQGTPSNPDQRASWSPSIARGKSAKRKPRRNGPWSCGNTTRRRFASRR